MVQYVICEYEKVKQVFPEFDIMMANLHTSLIAKASSDWDPLTFGGLNPTSGQFGETTILPPLFNDITNTQMVTWRQLFTPLNVIASLAGTAQGLLTGSGTAGTIPEDYMVGFAGICFLDKAIKVTEIKLQIGDRKIGRINLEEAMTYNKPCVVLEQGLTMNEKEGFELYGYIQAQGYQRIKPIGFQLNKVPNKVQVTHCGQAL
jgi:hypothetical protein